MRTVASPMLPCLHIMEKARNKYDEYKPFKPDIQTYCYFTLKLCPPPEEPFYNLIRFLRSSVSAYPYFRLK
jgi:hypothetical protein